MLQSRGLALKDRITFNDKLLDQYRDRVAQLTAAHSQAQKRFVTAQTELAIATTELDDTLAHYQLLRDETEELRSSIMTTPLPPWLMQTFPEELLRAIFLRALQASGGWEPVMTWKDALPRMEAPFVLASVCRRWRSIAVDSPDLWTFICPPPVRPHKMHLTASCTQLLLLRSGSAPLDVACLYPSNEVFTIVFEHRERVRKLALNLGQIAIKSTLGRIRYPMPLLEHISLFSDAQQAEGEWPHPRYLTFAPALTRGK
ncbi:hypothetical protein EXIGLDRAFT_424610 [Exidia glandulosa HHB12029]|uniref:Uncharacterized protein n=1 Tax=Exidia glandulosa HHB12029 TaxID=1314781 RepID=A0A165KKK3_EXIGL|nr:hypothetical protein EXIGLDRAFT_424610 [Exidia glandulosa HHB12029]